MMLQLSCVLEVRFKLIDAIHDKNPKVRYIAINSINNMSADNITKASPVLIKALSDENYKVRSQAALALRDIDYKSSSFLVDRAIFVKNTNNINGCKYLLTSEEC